MTKNESDQQLVIFQLDNEYYGIEISQVQEVIKYINITPLPNASEFLLGVINLRDKIIPVVDIRNLFGLPSLEETKHTRIIIVSSKGITVGLIVDSINEVVSLPGSAVEYPEDLIVQSTQQNVIEGVGRLEDRLVLLLAIDKFIDNIRVDITMKKQKVA